MPLKKTTMWLTPREHAALRALALQLGRTQSDLIREGIRRVLSARSGPARRTTQRRSTSEWEELTRDEYTVLGQLNAGRFPSEIAALLPMTDERVQECIAGIERKTGLINLSKEG